MQSARPQTAVKQEKKALVTLSLSINKKLLEQFPTDKYADVTIQIKSKRFELQKAHLRIETNYFDTQKVYSIIDQDPEICEGILRCIYGGSYLITSYSDLYSAYQISALFKIESLCKQVEQAFEINRKSFTYAFQLSESYNLEELRSQCYDFLESNVDAFTSLLDIGMLKIRKNHKKSGPSDVLRLKKSCFILLIEAHNSYKHNHKFLSYQDLFKVIELYSKDEEMTKELVVKLIDSNNLNSKEYEDIYYKLSLKCQSAIQQEPKIQQCHNSIKDFKINQMQNINLEDYFDRQKTDIILNKKRVQELMAENSRLHQENQKLQIALETSMQSTSNLKDSLLESIQNQLDQKMFDKDKQIQLLKEQVKNLNDMIMQKDYTIQTLQESDDMFNDREETQTIVLQESDIQMVQSELQVYQPFQQSTTSLSITQTSRYEFDYPSQVLDQKNQLHYFLDHIGVTIFQQITLRKQYLGTRDGFDINSFELACNQKNNFLILMKVFDYDKIIGIYIEGEFNIGELKRDIILLNISNQSLEHQQVIKLCANNNLIELDGLTIVENCDTSTGNVGSRYLTGDQKFQVDDIECYSIEISNGI